MPDIKQQTRRILIVDDHPLLRIAIKQVLSNCLDNAVIDEASTEDEAMSLIRTRTWELILLDIVMPGRGGLELLQEIRLARPSLPVIVLSSQIDAPLVVRALREGASGFISKSVKEDELTQGIRTVLEAGKYVSSDVAQQVALNISPEGCRPMHEALSDREFQILCLIGSGLTAQEIGRRLSLSVKTVNTYRHKIFTKMRLSSNAQLMHYAIRARLVP